MSSSIPSPGVDRAEATRLIKAKSLELGFQLCGVARAESLAVEGGRFRDWLASGFHASMGWMERTPERRVDPRMVLPGAQSVFSVAMNYYTPHTHGESPEAGKVSRYAWGDDYHEILQERLSRILVFIQELLPGTEGRFYVDTGPVLEKAWAQRAGVGWIGKHSNLISQELGSWIFLGELLLTAELEYDAPATDHCGTCTLCIDACPTGAIAMPYVVDSNKCISYLTIEHRGPIDPAFANQMEGWVYGCDICQDVCPWNGKFAHPTSEPGFQPREHNLDPALAELAALDEAEFRRRYAGSPMKRTKLAGIRRNAEFISGHGPETEQNM